MVIATEEAHMMTSDNELFILGLLKEQRQEEKDKERIDQVRNLCHEQTLKLYKVYSIMIIFKANNLGRPRIVL